jgi:hypothetical protein
MTDSILDILCPERTIDDDEALRLLQYAKDKHPDAWTAFRFLLNGHGVEEACRYLMLIGDVKLHRLAEVMPRLQREKDEKLHPQLQPMVAPRARQVLMAVQGGKVMNSMTMESDEFSHAQLTKHND